jgi:hypothetical protein
MSAGFHLIQNSASNKILTITNNIEQMPKERVEDDRDRERRLGDAREELLTPGLRGADLFQDKASIRRLVETKVLDPTVLDEYKDYVTACQESGVAPRPVQSSFFRTNVIHDGFFDE